LRYKQMTEIYGRLVDHTITNTNKINDFSIGSAVRAIYEATAREIEQLYILTEENIREAIATGVYSSFGFQRKPAQRAYGKVQLVFHNAVQQTLPLPRGTRFTSSLSDYTMTYETVEDYYIPQGTVTAEVQIYCTITGEIGNVPNNVINIMMTPLANIKTVTNAQAFQTGQDEEPLEELKSRFRSYIESLSKGTIPALEYGTRSVIEISGVWVDEQTGIVYVYAHDRNGDLPDVVRDKVIATLQNYRAAGIPVVVRPVTRKAVNIDVTIVLTDKTAITKALQDKIVAEISRYLNNMQTSQSVILSDLSSVIKGIDRRLIYDITFNDPKANVIVAGNEVVRAGTVKVTLT